VHCHPTGPTACADRANWKDEVRLTDTSFNMRQAPFGGTATLSPAGFFTGDYEGLASDGADLTAFFSQSHGSDPSSAFFRRVGP
jgi:hypothetical protein